MNPIRLLKFIVWVCCAVSPTILLAQDAGPGDPAADCIPPAHRLRLLGGPGYAELLPGFLSESAPSWTLNSFLESSDDDLYQAVIPFKPKVFQAPTLHGDLDYSYKDRLHLRFKTYQLIQEFGRNSATRTDFFAPAAKNFRWAYFEGVRLQKYKEDRRSGEIMYLHPINLPGLKVGGYFEDEQYIEINDISFGSFVATKGASPFKPGTTTWSELGLVPGEYRMRGQSAGAALQLQLLPSLGFIYKVAALQRSGTLKLSGVQYLTEDQHGGYTQENAVWPLIYAESSDRGLRHNFEATFTFLCNYGVHLGFLYEDFKRDYDIYLSQTFEAGDRLLSQKTPGGIGFGEMSRSHKIVKSEVYLKFSAALYFE